MKILARFTLLMLIAHTSYITAANANEKSIIKVTPVTVTQAINSSMIKTTVVRGEIESPNTPFLAAKVAAQVASVEVDDGMPVLKGQLLAALDDEAFTIAAEKASANIQRLVALAENQQREVKRSNELFAKKLISQSVLDDALTAMKQLQAELLAAKADLKEAQYQLSHTKIISPVNGVIQQRLISTGDYAKVGNSMFQIVSLDNIRARIYFPDSLAALITIGMQVSLTKESDAIQGVITQIRPMLENGTRALHGLVEFDNSKQWKPGSSISAKIELAKNLVAIAIPTRALVRRPAGIVVYRVLGNKVTEQLVSTGLNQNDLTEITEGLKVGDDIALDGAAWLTDGAIISIQKSSQAQ